MGLLLLFAGIFFVGLIAGGIVGYLFSLFVLLILSAFIILYFLRGLSREGERPVRRFYLLEAPFIVGFLLGIWGMQIYIAIETPLSILR
jgi:hypothetical protein